MKSTYHTVMRPIIDQSNLNHNPIISQSSYQAVKILEAYFGLEEEEEGALAPSTDAQRTQYAFGAAQRVGNWHGFGFAPDF